jgi:hypothetical protein
MGGWEAFVVRVLRSRSTFHVHVAVQSGTYRNPSEVLDRASEMVREQVDRED